MLVDRRSLLAEVCRGDARAAGDTKLARDRLAVTEPAMGCPAVWHRRRNLGIGAQKRRKRSTVDCGAGPAARILSSSLNATDGAISATRREAGFPVLTAGLVAYFATRVSTDLVDAFWLDGCSGVLAPLPPRGSRPRDGKKASTAMTRSGSTSARRVGITEARRLSLAIDARRRLNPRQRMGRETRPPRSESTLRVPNAVA